MNDAFLNLVTSPTVQAGVGIMFKNLISNLAGKNHANREQHLKEVEALKEEVEKLKIGRAQDSAKILESKDKELIVTCRRNETLQREVLNLRKKLLSHQKSGKVSDELQKENDDMTKAIAEMEEERKNILALKEAKEIEIAKIKEESELQKKQMADLMKLMVTVSGSMSGEGTSSNSEASEEELLKKLKGMMEKVLLESEGSKKTKKKNKPGSSKGGDDKKIEQVQINAIPNYGSNIPGPCSPNMGPTNAYVGHHYPNMGQTHHTVLQPCPNMGPNPMVSQQYPNVVQCHPNVGQLYMNQQHGNMAQQGPHMIPVFAQTLLVPPQTTRRPQNVPSAYCDNVRGQPLQMNKTRSPLLPTPPPLMDINVPSSSRNSTSNKPSEKPSYKPNIVGKPNNFNEKQRKKPLEKKLNDKVNNDMEKSSNVNPVKSANKDAKNKSGPSKDLWSQLDELKLKLDKKETPKKDLHGEISSMISDAASSSITSKEHFINELSKCLKIINELPDANDNSSGSGSHQRGRRGNFHRGRGNYYRRPQGPKIDHSGNYSCENKNTNDNDFDDASSLCSEPGYSRGRRGNFHRGRGYNKRFQGPRTGQNRNDDFHNKNINDNESDGGSSICSESSTSRYFRGRGRGKWRGNNRGRGYFRGNNRGGNNRGGYMRAAKSCGQLDTSSDVETAIEATEDVQCESSVQDECEEFELLHFDDDDDEVPSSNVDDKYASDEVMELFFGSDIPTLMDAIINKIDVTKKVRDCILISSANGDVVQEKPSSLLDIIQFKQNYSDAICLSEM